MLQSWSNPDKILGRQKTVYSIKGRFQRILMSIWGIPVLISKDGSLNQDDFR